MEKKSQSLADEKNNEVEGTGPFIILSTVVPMLLGMIMEASNKCNKSMIDYYLDAIMHQ